MMSPLTSTRVATAGAEALLGFARPEPAPADVAAVVVRVSRLAGVCGESRVRVNDESDGRARTSAPVELVRAAVARSVLAAVVAEDGAACEIAVDDGIFLRITGATRVPPPPDSDLVAAALEQGIRIAPRERSIELRFPAADQRVNPNAPS